jgi:hypothetical protein
MLRAVRPRSLLAVAPLVLACTGQIDGRGGGAPAASAPATPGAPRSIGAPNASVPGPAAGACLVPARRIWRLTADQLAHAYDQLLGLKSGAAERLRPLQPETRLYTNNAAALAGSENAISELFGLATDLAAKAVTQPSQLHPCLVDQLQSDACIGTFIGAFGARAFRRPVEPDEAKDYLDFFAGEAGKYGRAVALRQLVRRFLVAPAFLFRTELGAGAATGATRLTPYETASAISFFLLDGPPDAALTAAAASGALASRDEVTRQAQRLLGSPDTAPGLTHMIGEAIAVDKVATRAPPA